MILNLLSVLIIIICIIYMITIVQELFDFYVKELVKNTLDECKEREQKIAKMEAQISIQKKKNQEEEEKRIYSLLETYMQKNKLNPSDDLNHSEE